VPRARASFTAREADGALQALRAELE